MNKGLFIKTKDEETKNNLLSCGFKLLNKQDGFYVFMNDKNLIFDKNNKVVYTNILNM